MSKELADRIVALGVGAQKEYPKSCDGVGFYHTPGDDGEGLCADLFVNDGRVVLTLMEKFNPVELWSIFEKLGIGLADKDKITAPAICEACCNALEGE